MKFSKTKICQCIWVFTISISGLIAQDSIKIMTYNLMGMKPNTDWQTRLHHTIQHLKTINPDIIGLQEINEPQGGGGGINMAEEIADSLGVHFNQYYFVYQQVTHTSWSQFDESIGIISKHPIISNGYDNLPPGVFPRKVVWTYLQTPIGYLHFFNTHLSYLTEHNAIRLQQVNEIKEFVTSKESSWNGIGSILVGDLNCTPSSDPVSALTNPESGVGFTGAYAYSHSNSSGYTYPAGDPYKKIDYNFIKNSSYIIIDTSYIVINTPYNGQHYPSDHYGLLTILSTSDTPLTTNLQSPSLPETYVLQPAYPNPFNATISIPIMIHKDQLLLVITINDITGKNIRTLCNRKLAPGKHIINWDGLDDDKQQVASGVYFITLRLLGRQGVQKIILLK